MLFLGKDSEGPSVSHLRGHAVKWVVLVCFACPGTWLSAAPLPPGWGFAQGPGPPTLGTLPYSHQNADLSGLGPSRQEQHRGIYRDWEACSQLTNTDTLKETKERKVAEKEATL